MLKKPFLLPFLVIALFSSQVAAQDPGFFLDAHEEKTADLPTFSEYEKPTAAASVVVTGDFSQVIIPVGKFLFGNNANPYMTQIVSEPTLLNHISDLSPNIIRYPGGNLSSIFFWNAEKNIWPADAPDKILDANGQEINPGYWAGKNEESWTLSVDNYYEMLEQTNSTGIITINYGYARYGLAEDPVAAAAHLAADWVRYDNGRTKYWEIGNESGGSWQAGFRIDPSNNQDGQPAIITGALYGKHFNVFADSMQRAADEIGAEIYIGAQLLAEAPASWWNDTDRFWNDGVFEESGDLPDYYIIHSYYTPYAENSSVNTILNSGTSVTQNMMEYVTGQIVDAALSAKPVALTEWNIFAEGSKQSVSYVSGMHAAIVLGELIKNKYGMASRWDLANAWGDGNDHGMFSQGDQPGVPKWTPRPSFYYMYYFQKYFGDTMVGTTVNGSENILAYASSFSSGETGYVIVNKDNTAQVVSIIQTDKGFGDRFYFYTLTGGTDNGEFSLKVLINGNGPSLPAGGPSNYKTLSARSALVDGGVKFSAPARSVTYLIIDNGEGMVTDIREQNSTNGFIHPNPAETNFVVDVLPGDRRIEIVDAKGIKVYAQNVDPTSTQLEIKTDNMSGLYFVHVRGSQSRFQKLIVR